MSPVGKVKENVHTHRSIVYPGLDPRLSRHTDKPGVTLLALPAAPVLALERLCAERWLDSRKLH